jgi:chromosome segregation ATPase
VASPFGDWSRGGRQAPLGNYQTVGKSGVLQEVGPFSRVLYQEEIRGLKKQLENEREAHKVSCQQLERERQNVLGARDYAREEISRAEGLRKELADAKAALDTFDAENEELAETVEDLEREVTNLRQVENILRTNYGNLTANTLEAIDAHQAEIQRQELEVARLTRILEANQQRIAELESKNASLVVGSQVAASAFARLVEEGLA